jgi:trk system potassium uptake protein TrkA
MRSMLIIGAGNFGKNLAIELTEMHNEVMVVDINEEAIQKIEEKVTCAQIGDCMDREVLESLGVANFDVCFVCISDHFQSSLEITSLLKEMNAKFVVSKADHEIHADLLKKIGADEVVYPERDMAKRTAVKYSAKGVFEYIELSPEYVIMEIEIPKGWVGKSLKDLDIRSRCSVNVIGIRVGKQVVPLINAEYVFLEHEHIIVAGEENVIIDLIEGSK